VSLIRSWQIKKAQEKKKKRSNVVLFRQRKLVSREEQNDTSVEYQRGSVGYRCPDFLQGGVAMLFYLMMICTQGKLWYTGKRQSQHGSIQFV